MPLSELHPMAKGKLRSGQQRTTTCSTDLSFAPENDFAELVWENGQIMMQNQSSRARKDPSCKIFPSHTVKPRDKDAGNATNSKMGKFGMGNSMLDDFPLLVPSGEMVLNQDDDMVPWFSYPMSDSLQPEFGSDLLPEVSGVTANEHSIPNNFASIEKSRSYNPVCKDSYNVCVHSSANLEQGGASKVCYGDGEPTRLGGHLYPSASLQHETSLSSLRPRASEITTNSVVNAHHTSVDSIPVAVTAGNFPSSNMKTQAAPLTSVSSGVINFSHFARPAALAKANFHGFGARAAPDILRLDEDGYREKAFVANSGNCSTSMPNNASDSLQNEMALHSQPILVLQKVDPKSRASKPQDELAPAEKSDAICQENTIKSDKSTNQILAASSAVEMPYRAKTVEPVITSSSVCSGNSMEEASNGPKHNAKRKCREYEESEGPSDDVEEESLGVRKAAPSMGGSSSKRSRAAEVHNLSERRRRDRINEKMRALQELIPNCNKVDKASMLDEAIEYLKTLQLQVQIMSMGTGLCMPPMMFPPGMQHMHTAHMGQFSHMGVGLGMGMGMGMGVGFGMGMVDMNGSSPGCPMYQASPMQGVQFSGPPISAPTSFQRMAGPNFQLFGVPGQGLPMPMPRPPSIPMAGSLPIKSTMELNASGITCSVQVSDSVPASNSKDLPQNIDSEAIQKTDARWSVNQIPGQATNEEPGLVQERDQSHDVSGVDTVYPTSGNENVPSKAACYDRRPMQ